MKPVTRPRHESTDLTSQEHLEFWRIVLRQGWDAGTVRIWSNILYFNPRVI